MLIGLFSASNNNHGRCKCDNEMLKCVCVVVARVHRWRGGGSWATLPGCHSGDSTSWWWGFVVRARVFTELLAFPNSDGTYSHVRIHIRIVHDASRELELYPTSQTTLWEGKVTQFFKFWWLEWQQPNTHTHSNHLTQPQSDQHVFFILNAPTHSTAMFWGNFGQSPHANSN